MDNGNGFKYAIDIVFCIDATGSMQGLIDKVKNNALSFYNDLIAGMNAKGKKADSIRVKVVAFRDYVADKNKAMLVTDFFNLPYDNERFEQCIRSIKASGGGDEPEDGLEALAYSIRSNWNKSDCKKRQVIVIWTDASTHDLGYGRTVENYPRNMAANFAELSEWWGDSQLPSDYIDENAKRLILFAPDVVKKSGAYVETSWGLISDNWNNVIHYPSKAGEGLDDVDYHTILDTITNSI